MLDDLVLDAMRAEPPRVKGVFLRGRLRAVLGHTGSGRDRLFWLDGVAEAVSFRWLVRHRDKVALRRDAAELLGAPFPALAIRFGGSIISCPSCGEVVDSPVFWEHYNREHARVPDWLNERDWLTLIGGHWIDPTGEKDEQS